MCLGSILAATIFAAVALPGSAVLAGDDASVGGTFQVVTDLVISDIRVSAITRSAVTVSWVTNVPATSQVFYDTGFHENTADYARYTTEDTTLVIEHSLRLTGLVANTTYHFRVRSAVDGLEGISSDYNFHTRSPYVPGPSSGPVTAYLRLVMFGEVSQWPIDYSGHLLEDVNVTSADGRMSLFLGEGTACLDDSGQWLNNLLIEIAGKIPDPAPGYFLLNYAYDLGPRGATFDPYLKLTLTYEDQDIPEGIAEEDLFLAYYGDGWVPLTSLVDSQRNEVSADVGHLTIFALMAKTPPSPSPANFTTFNLSINPTEVEVGKRVSIALEVKNTGGSEGVCPLSLWVNNSLAETREVTLAPGAARNISFSVTEGEPGTYLVDIGGLTGSFTVKGVETVLPTEIPVKRTDWAVLGPILGVGIFLAVFLPLKLRRRTD